MRNDQGLMFHLLIKEGDIGRYVLMPGDPGTGGEDRLISWMMPNRLRSTANTPPIPAACWGRKVSVISTGIGCPSTAIAVEEAIEAGADTMIRVGTSGSMQPRYPHRRPGGDHRRHPG